MSSKLSVQAKEMYTNQQNELSERIAHLFARMFGDTFSVLVSPYDADFLLVADDVEFRVMQASEKSFIFFLRLECPKCKCITEVEVEDVYGIGKYLSLRDYLQDKFHDLHLKFPPWQYTKEAK